MNTIFVHISDLHSWAKNSIEHTEHIEKEELTKTTQTKKLMIYPDITSSVTIFANYHCKSTRKLTS